MSCEQFHDTIGELVDGTIDETARPALEAHLQACDECRALVADLRQIRERAASLDRPQPPNRVWTAIEAELAEAEDARSALTSVLESWRWLAAAVLVIVAGVAVWMVPSLSAPGSSADRTAIQTAEAEPPEALIESVEAELRLAESHYENAISGLEQIAILEDEVLDPDVAATLEKSLEVIDQAIAESRAALRAEPASQVARESLFDVMWRKVSLLQDTIALVNEMRKGNEDGAARIVEGLNRH